MGSRPSDIIWLDRPVGANCTLEVCLPQIAKGTLHWPSGDGIAGVNGSCDASVAMVCEGPCACSSGVFAGWDQSLAPYVYVFFNVIYMYLVGLIINNMGALYRAKCDAFSSLILYWIGNPLKQY